MVFAPQEAVPAPGGPLVAVIRNEDYGKSSTIPAEGQKAWTVKEMKNLCRHYGIGDPCDSMWMFEWALKDTDRRLDVLTVDLSSLWVRGFEVKASRADFTSDKKWKDYLPFVNEFWFCAPPGVIDKDELPEDVGLLEPDQLGGWDGKHTRLVARRRAKALQPAFARDTYTERWMTQVLVGFARNLQYREGRLAGWCECGKRFELDHDGRAGGTR